MKLRVLLGVLILANGLYFAWAQGLMRAYGFAPVQQSEPQRMAQQIRPEAVHILTPTELKKEEALAQSDSAPKECLQSGPFDEAQTRVLRAALERLPSGSWQLDVVDQPARWIVYMGKYANAEILAKKRAELANMNLKIEALTNPALEIGLSLGGFDSLDAATAELARFNQRGIKTARVVQERAASSAAVLKLPSVTAALKAQLEEIKPELAGKPLKKCG